MYSSSWQAMLSMPAKRLATSGHARMLLAAEQYQHCNIVRLCGSHAQPLAAAAACLQHMQTLHNSNKPLVLVTRTGVGARPANMRSKEAAEAVQALLRVAAAERPGANFAGLCISSLATLRSHRDFILGMAAGGSDCLVEGSCAHSQRLLPLSHGSALSGGGPAADRQAHAFSGSEVIAEIGDVVITGGLGSLGRLSTGWLLQGGGAPPSTVLLLGRTGRSGSVEAMAGLLCAAPTLTRMARCDLAMSGDASACIPRRTTAVLHTAGVLSDGLIGRQGTKSLRDVFAPKLGGAGAVPARLAASPLAAVVLYSSVAGLLGSAGQGSYAAANSALDAAACMHSIQARSCLNVVSNKTCALSALDITWRCSAAVSTCTGQVRRLACCSITGRLWGPC